MKLKCKRGHALEGENLIHRKVTEKETGELIRETRECRECANAGFRRRRQNKEKKDKLDRARGAVIVKKEKRKMTDKDHPNVIDPMEFLETSQPAQADNSQTETVHSDPPLVLAGTGSPLQLRIVHHIDGDGNMTEILFDEIKTGDRFTLRDLGDNPIEIGTNIYTAESDAEVCGPDNYMVKIATDIDILQQASPTIEMESAEAKPVAPEPPAKQPEASTDIHGNHFDPVTHTVPAAVPNPPPRQVGCPHGFTNQMLCTQCRAAS